MKKIKILLGIFMVTLVTSSFSVFAYSTANLTISGQVVPGFNGSWISGGRTKINNGTQSITQVNTTRSLDVKLQIGPSPWADISNWYLLETNKNVIFPDNGIKGWYPNIALGDYRLYVDSRITYINNTTINKAVYSPGN